MSPEEEIYIQQFRKLWRNYFLVDQETLENLSVEEVSQRNIRYVKEVLNLYDGPCWIYFPIRPHEDEVLCCVSVTEDFRHEEVVELRWKARNSYKDYEHEQFNGTLCAGIVGRLLDFESVFDENGELQKFKGLA